MDLFYLFMVKFSNTHSVLYLNILFYLFMVKFSNTHTVLYLNILFYLFMVKFSNTHTVLYLNILFYLLMDTFSNTHTVLYLDLFFAPREQIRLVENGLKLTLGCLRHNIVRAIERRVEIPAPSYIEGTSVSA